MHSKIKYIIGAILGTLGVLFIIFLVLFIIYKSTTKDVEESDNTTEKTITAYIFRQDGCSFCESAMEFFLSMKELYPYLTVKTYEVKGDSNNRNLMSLVSQELGIEDKSSVPLIVIGSSYSLRGFSTNYRDSIMNEILEAYYDDNYEDIVEKIILENNLSVTSETLGES